MDVRSLAGRTAVITGAASGIGRAVARACAARGADLALCDLDEAGLADAERELGGPGRRVLARRVDVSRADEMEAFARAVHELVPAADLLVNNAGVALGAGFLDTTLEDWDWIVSINLRGVVHGCHFFVPPMVQRGRGHVVNVASAAGFVAGEALAAYCTTKFAVLGLSEALHEELARHGVGVTAVCPGFIDTPIARNARTRGPWARPEARRLAIESLAKRGYPPERVARQLLRAVQRGRVVAPIAPEAWLLWYLKRLSPALLRRLGALLARRSRRRLALGDGP